MPTIKAYLRQAKEVRSNLLDESENIIFKNENKIVQLQTSQLDDGMGENDNFLFNKNPVYKGLYTLYTQMLYPEKISGTLYTFNLTGDFLSSLQLKMSNDKLSFEIFSTGTGSGAKKAFFDGYTNLFGLDNKNAQIVNYNILLPEILSYINSKL